MKSNRRQFIQTSATIATAAATASRSPAADPFAPAEAGLPGRIFDKGRQHVLPRWAFDGYRPTPGVRNDPPRLLIIPPMPKPVAALPFRSLIKDKMTGVFPESAKAAFGDGKAPGEVLHGIAVEWNGTLIGGNDTDRTAWQTMQERVKPEQKSQYGAGGVDDDTSGRNWDAYGKIRTYRITMQEKLARLHPEAGFPALLYSYADMVPGPTFRFRHGVPVIVRFDNQLQTEASIHHHGGHNPSHSDGFPSFYALQGEAKDYLYPNILPLRLNGEKTELDYGEGQSTTWYHDHGLDVTAFNVSRGLAGFVLWFDDLELKLIREGVLPGFGVIIEKDAQGNPVIKDGRVVITNPSISGFDPELDVEKESWDKAWSNWKAASPSSYWSQRNNKAASGLPDSEEPADVDFNRFHRTAATPYFNPYDLPIVLQDRIINVETGQIVYDSDGHNGYIGDIQLINGCPWPAFKVKRRKYRLRLLDGSNARIYRLRFLDSDTFGLAPNGDGAMEPANLSDAALKNNAMEFFRIGKDSWLWPAPQKRKSLILNMANRADLVVDFHDWYEKAKNEGRLVADPQDPNKLVAEYYLVNTMPQFDGRGPKGKLEEDAGDPQVFPLPFGLEPTNEVVRNMQAAGVIPGGLFGAGPTAQMRELNQPVGLLKFIIEDDAGEGEDCPNWKGENTILRPRHTLPDADIMAVREFVFERGKGAWMNNGRFYDPTISNAGPVSGIKGKSFWVPSAQNPFLAAKSNWLTLLAELKTHLAGTAYGDFWTRLSDSEKDAVNAAPDAAPDDNLTALLLKALQREKWALPSLDYAEEWILRNGGGGWWHPIHIHLEGHQLIGYEKDFAADGLVDGDGVLGAAAQANMADLPRWGRMVTEFGLDPLIRQYGGVPGSPPAASLTQADHLNRLRRLLLVPDHTTDFTDAPIGGNTHLLEIILDREVRETAPNGIEIVFKRGAAAVLPLLRAGKPFTDILEKLGTALKNRVNTLLDDLDQLRLAWVGEMTGNHDTQALGPNTAARIRMRFRTWSGPFVFHCHNVEHEDMRMMANFEPTIKLKPDGTPAEPNEHDPNVYPTARTHGQDVTDLNTNPNAVGEMPWEEINGFPHFHQAPVPYTAVDRAGDPLIKPRPEKQ